MTRVGILPTLVTMANGYCGLLAIFKTHDGKFASAALFILVAMIFDVLDGMVARKAGITSRFGAYLDSLCDAISFGVAPAFLVKAAVEASGYDVYGPKVLTVLTSIFALCALLRLARYNVEHTVGEGTTTEEGTAVESFAGMPTPGAAGVLAALVFLQGDENPLVDYGFLYWLLPVFCAVLGYLMVSRVPYVHASRLLKRRRDFAYLFRVVVIAVVLVRFPHECTAVAFLLYGFSGPVRMLLGRGPVAEPPDTEESETP
ncbi:MAG: CDP-diacylglycerol--serine O-phosphatidyltransferase [Planctomycetota bacterium]|jgi:CDP-diacylglycerol--serine O-phosphatidyltransferase